MAHIASIQSGNYLSESSSAHVSSKASTTICPTIQQLPLLLRSKVVNNHQRRRPSFCKKVSTLQAERTSHGRVHEHRFYRTTTLDAHLKEKAVGANVRPTVQESNRFSKLGGFSKRGSLGKVACTAGDFVSPVEEPLADAVEPPPVEEELSQLTLIWRAVKLPIYTVALIPILVGAAAAYQKTGVFYPSRFWTLLGSSCLVIAWLNLTNDVFDSDTEVDKNKRESVVNMTGSRDLVLVIAIALLVIAFGGFAWLAKTVNDPRMLWLLAGAVACGYVYQSPPFRLGYLGLGEPLCFISFGPLATSAFYLSQVKKSCCKALPAVTPTVLGASVLVGITTTLILFCSHFHQIEDDEKVGKMSPLVRLGTARGAQVARTAVTALYLVTGALVGTKLLPPWCGILSALTIPLGKLVKDFITKNHQNKVVIFMAKYFATRLHLAHGVAIALGLAASVWKPLPYFW